MTAKILFKKRRRLRQEIDQAKQRLKQKRYEETFQICQDIQEKWKKAAPPEILYAGACALLGLGHVHQAEQWLDQYGKNARNKTDYLYLSAYFSLHRGRPEQALLDWTSILHLNPSDTFADHLIERLKRSEEQVLAEIADPYNFNRYVPIDFLERSAKKPSAKVLAKMRSKETESDALRPEFFWKLIAYGLVAGALSILGSVLFFFDIQPFTFLSTLYNNDLVLPQAPRSGTLLLPTQYGAEAPRFFYSAREEAIADYESARKQILSGKVNRARLILGRLELSNISFEIKERVLLLRASIPFIELDEFHDPLSAAQIEAEPYLYRGAQIFWQARFHAIKPKPRSLELELSLPDPSQYTLIVDYPLSQEKRKELLPKLSRQNEIRVFGSFQGLEAKRMKIRARKLLLISGF